MARTGAQASGVPQGRADVQGTPISVPGLPNFAKVDDGLYRCAQPTTEGLVAAEKMGIRTVINLRSAHHDRAPGPNCKLLYMELPCHAWSMNEEEVEQFLRVATDPKYRPVLVHCAHGQDRTGLAVAAYRVRVQGWSCADAASEMDSYGACSLWGNLKRCIFRLKPHEPTESAALAGPAAPTAR
jgi:protein tyrosine phosphatase (PTP) superfamily phosphohydrolase (DUF442 family)